MSLFQIKDTENFAAHMADGSEQGADLPDDADINSYSLELPDDSGVNADVGNLPDDSGRTQRDTENSLNEIYYSNLDDMKYGMGKTYAQLKEMKPPHSPNLGKWFEKGGTIKIERSESVPTWTYIDNNGREVPYVDGYPRFPQEAKHVVISDISIGKFTGERNEDKRLYLELLEEEYGLTEIPDGYALHHDTTNGNMQLIKEDWHKEFSHTGGHSKFKEVESC